jgi:hypothetical protein
MVLVGGLAGVGAVVVLAAGGGWWAFWLVVSGLLLVTAPARRQYWDRVEREDAASVPLRVMWICAGLAAVSVLLGVTQLMGMWFRQDTVRGLGMFVAAFLMGIAWWKACGERRRLQREARIDAADGVSGGLGQG